MHATSGEVADIEASSLIARGDITVSPRRGSEPPSAFPWRLEQRIRVLTVVVDYVVVQSQRIVQ
jgi:hypothetical protein